MIEINLLPGKKRAPKGAGMQLKLPDFRALITQIKDPWLIAAAAATIVVGGAVMFYLYERTQLAALNARLASAKVERRRYDQYIAELRRAERLRDSLVMEIGVIRGIDQDRYVWPHLLDQISKALPPYTWLVDVSHAGISAGAGAPAPPPPPPPIPPAGATGGSGAAARPDSVIRPPVRVSITGRTLDMEAYTTFLRQLANSPWLTEVTAAQSLTKVEEDRPVTEFNITVRYRPADSIYVRTQPLAQAVR